MYVRFKHNTYEDDYELEFNYFGINDPLDTFCEAVHEYCNRCNVRIRFEDLETVIPERFWWRHNLYLITPPCPIEYTAPGVFSPRRSNPCPTTE